MVSEGWHGCVQIAEQTPLTGLRLGQLALEAGIPAGVLNVIPGFGAKAGAALASHTGVDKASGCLHLICFQKYDRRRGEG